MNKHTPGPWFNLGQGDIVTISLPSCSADGITDVASVYIGSSERHKYDAILIASSPTLLEELQFAVSVLKPISGCTVQVQRMEAAIALATLLP